jgi:MFS transporter, FHS family, L-fucose permease
MSFSIGIKEGCIVERNSILRSSSGKSFLFPFLLISSLYLLWGCAHGMLDVLNRHFQGCFDMTKAESGFVQFSTYLAYFIMAIPAGYIMRKLGYKKGLFLGLMIFALGAFAFIPAAYVNSPLPFLCALFFLACGLCIIETGAHPYATILGPPESAAQRINVAAAFNGVGWIIGPLLGGSLIFGAEVSDTTATAKPYMLIGAVVLVVAFALLFVKMPEIVPPTDEEDHERSSRVPLSLWKQPGFVLAVVAQFFYVAAQTGIFSFFINYVLELYPKLTNIEASRMLGFGGMGLFLVGRLTSSWFMRWVKPETLLTSFAIASSVCMVLVILSVGILSFVALCLSMYFMSMMFPTIFALGVHGLGAQTKQASSFIVMGVAGGAVSPVLMGYIGDANMAIGFFVPLACFLFIGYYGRRQMRFLQRL